MKTKTKVLMMALLAALICSCEKQKKINEPGYLVPKTVMEDKTIPAITVNGARLHSEAYGHPDSTIILMLHGGPGRDYRHLLNCKELAESGYRVVFYDQRGCGLSQRFSGESYTSLGAGAIDLMYDEVGAVIKHYRTSDKQKVILFGHSWGAMLATGYVGKHPNAVQGLISMDPGGLKWEDVLTFNKNSRSFGLFSEHLGDITYLDQFLTARQDEHEVLDYKMSTIAGDNYVTGELTTEPNFFWRAGGVASAALQKMGVEHKPDFSAGIENFQPTVLYCHAADNKANNPEWAHHVASAYRSVNILSLPSGHSGIIYDHNVWRNHTMPAVLQYIKSL